MKQKYLVIRRDGSVPRWPSFVIAAADPAAEAALTAYADAAERLGMSSNYVREVRQIAAEFNAHQKNPHPDDVDRRSECELVHIIMGQVQNGE